MIDRVRNILFNTLFTGEIFELIRDRADDRDLKKEDNRAGIYLGWGPERKEFLR